MLTEECVFSGVGNHITEETKLIVDIQPNDMQTSVPILYSNSYYRFMHRLGKIIQM